MTNMPPELMITHCGWGPFPAIALLPHLTLLVSLYLVTHGLIRKRKTGSAKPFGEILWIATTAFLAVFLTLGLGRLGELLYQQVVVEVPRTDVLIDQKTHFVAALLLICAWMVPPVAFGYIGSFVLRIKKQVENDSANTPSDRTQ